MELFWEPRKVAMNKVTPIQNEPEMSEFESAFLCGLIKTNRPKRILEIGVAAGGTTAIMMQCIDILNMNEECEIISVDINRQFYREDGRDTGFLGIELNSKLQRPINHKLLLGEVIAECIEEIGSGGGIDLVVLDTVHFLPGEVLDFPVILPFLSPNAIIVLHDIAYQYNVKEGMATQVLLDVIAGKKVIPIGEDKAQMTPMPNIGAVYINEDTPKYIDAVFAAMTLPWYYLPSQKHIKAYHDFYAKHYNSFLVEIFDVAIELNTKLIKEGPKIKMSFKDRVIRVAVMMLKGR